MDATARAIHRKAGRMSIATAIGVAGALIAVAIGWSIPHVYDYHTDLRNISYQLSRIADALNKKERREE